jgi:hypothetical protein
MSTVGLRPRYLSVEFTRAIIPLKEIRLTNCFKKENYFGMKFALEDALNRFPQSIYRALMKKILIAFAFACFGSLAGATTITATDSGWYNDAGIHDASNQNYIAGLCSDCGGARYRNFFVFDLSSIAGSITSAILRLDTANVVSSGIYDLFDVSTPISTLMAGGSGLTGIYNDLGSGSTFGSIGLLNTQDHQLVDITFNANGLAALNASSGLFAVGGTYTSARYHAFGGSNEFMTRQLIIETANVPEPFTIALLALGLFGIAAVRRRRRQG